MLPELGWAFDVDAFPGEPITPPAPFDELVGEPGMPEGEAALLEGLGFTPTVGAGMELTPAVPLFTPSTLPDEDIPVVPDVPLEEESLGEEEDAPGIPTLSEGSGKEVVPVASEGPSMPPVDVPEESVPDDDVPAVPDVPVLSVVPLIPFVDNESELDVPVVSCDAVPVVDESPDELKPDEVPAMLPLALPPDAANAVALSMKAAQAKGTTHFFSVTMTAPFNDRGIVIEKN